MGTSASATSSRTIGGSSNRATPRRSATQIAVRLGLVSCMRRSVPALFGHGDHVAVALGAVALRAQDRLERLIPRHVLHADGDRPLNLIGDDDVHVADLGDE